MPFDSLPDDIRREALTALRELILSGQNYRQSVASYFGIGMTETTAISYLYGRGEMGQTELACLLGRTTSSVTSLIDRLEAGDFAERVPDPGDRRRAIVRLTEKGYATVHETRDWFRGAFDGIADREVENATRLLSSLASGLRRHTETIGVEAKPDSS